MLAWLRLLLLALLIPAYGWAAAPWAAATALESAAAPLAQCAATTPSPLEPALESASPSGLLEPQEAADTSGELPEHGLPASGDQAAQAGTHKPSAQPWPEAPEAPPQRLLRPPMHLV